MKVRCLFVMILGIFLISIIPTISLSIEKYPKRTIEVIVPYAPGGPTDIGARAINEKFSKKLEVPVVVINKPGEEDFREPHLWHGQRRMDIPCLAPLLHPSLAYQ